MKCSRDYRNGFCLVEFVSTDAFRKHLDIVRAASHVAVDAPCITPAVLAISRDSKTLATNVRHLPKSKAYLSTCRVATYLTT